MPIQKTEKIWRNGEWINWDDATLHVLSHVVGYGSAVFEGIRCYDTKQGPAIFRLREHMQRLVNSARIYRMELPYTVDDFSNIATELVRRNKMNACYVKPIVLRGYGEAGVNPAQSHRLLHGLLALGRVSRTGGALERRRSRSQLVDAYRAEHASGDVQGRGQLHELAAHPHGSRLQRLRRRHCAR